MCKDMFIITHVNGVYDLQFDKQKTHKFILMNKKKIVKLFYMGILSIALKERSKNGLCRIAIAFDKMVMIFFDGICNFCFIC